MTKLNLACGELKMHGYVNIDNQSQYKAKPDINADIFTMTWQKNDVDEILLLHFMMYVEPAEAYPLFKKFYSWLKSGGTLIIETGDLKKVCKNILKTDNPAVINGSNCLMQLYGFQNTAGHKWAWCEETLRSSLMDAGFEVKEVFAGGTHKKPERDLTIIAIKP